MHTFEKIFNEAGYVNRAQKWHVSFFLFFFFSVQAPSSKGRVNYKLLIFLSGVEIYHFRFFYHLSVTRMERKYL